MSFKHNSGHTEKEIFKLPGVKGNQIHDVIIRSLKKIPDERGAIYHMMRNDDEIFEKFGEVYFSLVYPDIVKGWHLHKEMVLNYAVPSGAIKLVLYDNREGSPTKGNLMEILVGEENYMLIRVPPGIWNGFKGIGEKISIVCNCASIPHDPNEIIRLDPFDKKIPYVWSHKHVY